MNETLRRATYDVGTMLKVYTVLPVVTIPVALAWLEFYAVPAFAATAVLTYVLGRGLEYAVSGASDVEAGMHSGVLTVSIGWFLAGLLSAVPILGVALTIRSDPVLVATPARSGSGSSGWGPGRP